MDFALGHVTTQTDATMEEKKPSTHYMPRVTWCQSKYGQSVNIPIKYYLSYYQPTLNPRCKMKINFWGICGIDPKSV